MKLEEIDIQIPSFSEAIKSSETVDLYASTLILQSRLYADFLTRFLKKSKPWESARIILEIGCGPGGAVSSIARQGLLDGKNYLGVDLEAKFIELASTLTSDYPNLSFKQGDVLKNSFGRYDLILAIAVLQHLGDTKTAITRLLQNLKEDGCLLFFDTGADTFSDCTPPVPTLQKMYDHISAQATDGKRKDRCLLELEAHAANWGVVVEFADEAKMRVPDTMRDDFIRYSYFASELTKRFYNSPVSQTDLLSELLHWRSKNGIASLTGWRIVVAKNLLGLK